MLVFPDRNTLETAVELLDYVKAAGKTRQPLEAALKIVWPRLEISLDCLVRSSNFVFVSYICLYLRRESQASTRARILHCCMRQARLAFPADDVRFATFEMLMKVNNSGFVGADFEEHTDVCILNTLEAYLGDQHLALFDLAIEWGRETYVKVPVTTFEMKVAEIMATHEHSPLDYESVRYLWNIASYFALVPKNSMQVSQIADWLVHLITSGQHTLDDWQKQQVISGFWILQRDIAYSGGDPEACATADLKLLQFRVDCSKTIVEKVTWLSHGAQKLQDLGHVYSEIAEAIRTSIDAEVYQDMLMADSEGTGCEPPSMILQTPSQFPRSEDYGELHSKERDQGLLWERPHATSEDEDEISSDWPSIIYDTTMLRSCARESNMFLEPIIYSGYQI